MKLRECFVHDNTDSVIEDAFSKDYGVEMWVDLVLIEDGEDSDGVRRGQG
jgi:hypothetical protein